ncbi:MAG TPA: hypothetical protein VF322_02180 [Gammaproteobacteria bacterium]
MWKLSALGGALLAAGCALHVHHDISPPPDYVYTPPLESDPHFEYTAPGPVTVSEPLDTTRYHDVVRITFESSGHNGHPQNLVEGLYFRSRKPGPKKLVIVLPVWGASDYPPGKISRGYARRSRGEAHVIWLSGETPVFPWDELSSTESEAEFIARARDSAERFRSAVIDVRRLIDWAETRPEIDANRIGVVGFSMSALVTATLVGNDSRIGAAVIMMGSAEYANVFATCAKRAEEVREHVFREYGWSLEQYRSFFEELFAPADPVRYAGRYDPHEILMIDARFDDCMPRRSRRALYEATGHPERITLIYRHRTAFYSLTPLGMNFSRRRIYHFLDEVL